MKALALGGGGAKGLAHIGAVKAMTEMGIKFDIICGTSIGALVGAFYAADKLDALEEFALNVKLTDLPLLLSPSWSVKGLFSGKNALEEISDMLSVENIEDLPTTFGAVSASLNSGMTIHHTKGDLRSAIRASISIPGIFTPVERDSDTLIDGGLVEPVPVLLSKELGASKILAIDLFSANPMHPAKRQPKAVSTALSYLSKLPVNFLKRSSSGNILDVLEGSQHILQHRLTQLIFKDTQPDLTLEPSVREFGFLDFHIAKEIIEIGYEYTQAKKDPITQLFS